MKLVNGKAIMWRYSDGSGSGVMRVFLPGADGGIDSDLAMLREHGNSQYEIVSVEIAVPENHSLFEEVFGKARV